MPNAIHSFSSSAPELHSDIWLKFLMCCLAIYFGLRLLLRFIDFAESTIFAISYLIRAIYRRLARLRIGFDRLVLNTANNMALALFLLTFRLAIAWPRYFPRTYLKGYKRGSFHHLKKIDKRLDWLITEALATERAKDGRVCAYQVMASVALLEVWARDLLYNAMMEANDRGAEFAALAHKHSA